MAKGGITVSTSRESVAHDLWSYGEEELAEKIAALPRQTMEAIFARAGYYATADEYATPSGAGMLLAKALAMAAVEVMEGRTRELARKRRRPGSSRGDWEVSHSEAVERVAQGLEQGTWPYDPDGWEVQRRPSR